MKASDFTGIRKQLVSLAATAAFAGLALIAGSADAALIAHYELDGNALDSSGNSNDGTLVGDTSFVTGIDGQAAEFDGNGDDITATVTGLPFGNAERTISLWVNPDQSRFDQKFFDYGNSAQNGKAFSFTIEDSGGSPTIFFRHSGGNFQYTSASIALNEWSHVAMVVPTGATQTDDVLVYLNGSQLTGVQGGGSARTLDTTLSGIVIGGTNGTGANLDGSIDNVQIYDEALSAQDIAFLAADAGNVVPEPGSLTLLVLGGLLIASRRRRA